MFENDTAQSIIGKCEVLFCIFPGYDTVYSEAYEREIVVCEECHAERTGEKEVDESSKMYQFSELADDFLDGSFDD